MPSITFDAFFAELNDGHRPFAWQQRLVDAVMKTGTWPAQIVAPTGTGKSSVVDVHLYLNALYALGECPRVPRRLSVVVNRRALVDSHIDRAETILRTMQEAKAGSVLATLSQALTSLRSDAHQDPFIVSRLRGALTNKTLPVNSLEACAIIAATPDMWGSRALFRGYGSGRLARPRETALFTMDAVVLLDESHLNRQLLTTARRIAALQELEVDLHVPRLQVVAATATSTETLGLAQSIGVFEEDCERDPVIAQRIDSSKHLSLLKLKKWNGRPKNSEIIATAVEEVLRLCADADSTVGCIVNHVETATKIHRILKKKGLRSEILVGRMRPHDVAQMKARRPGLFTIQGSQEVDVLVATQTMEVGVDVDFAHLVTELAPGSSLTQRFGRVNRLGHRVRSEVSVLIPSTADAIKTDVPPYTRKDLLNSLAWLEQLAEAGTVNPRNLLELPAPEESPGRVLLQRLEWADLHNLCRTTDPLFAEPDLDLWLRDSLEKDPALGGVVVRSPLPEDFNAAVELLNATKPQDFETFPANIAVLNRLKDVLAPTDESFKQKASAVRHRAFLYRDSEVVLLDHDKPLRPTDILIIEPGTPFTTEGVASATPEDSELISPAPLPGIDVHVFDSAMDKAEAESFKQIAAELSEDPEETTTESQRSKGFQCSTMVLETDHHHGFDAVVPWYITETDDAIRAEEEALQEWSPTSKTVTLQQHQADVAEQADNLCTSVGLHHDFHQIVVQAAAHHDDGKIEPRFQTWLRGGKTSDDQEPWAKSAQRNRQEIRRAKNISGVPPKWRHEQLSALKVAVQLGYDTPETELILRIVGCSHGHGRSTFPYSSWEMISPLATDQEQAVARHLFSEGEWDSIIERTNRTIGPYAMAYLEALQRAADAHVSSEGR